MIMIRVGEAALYTVIALAGVVFYLAFMGAGMLCGLFLRALKEK